MACVNVYDCRLILRAVFRESSVSVMVTTRLGMVSALAAVGSTNTWKKTPWTWPAGMRPMFFGESRTRMAAAPGPEGVSVATTSA